MNDETDAQLLRAYAESRSEEAFTFLVSRHVDFVFSAARRMVCDSHLAEDVTQGVFIALAKNASQLTDRPVLAGWLHRTAQNIAAQTVRTDVRRQAREQEAVAMNELLSVESDSTWEDIAPHLDAALGELSEPDRDALLLRYFERKSAREMAQTLGVSDEAAQKRMNRAVDRLRDNFAKQGFTFGASGLVALISVNAVQAAPVGLAITISTAAALAGAITTTATATIVKTIAMTTLQKTIITATLAAAVGTGIYEARQVAAMQNQLHIFEKQQAPLVEKVRQLTRDYDNATNQIAALRDENERLKRATTEIPKLRGDAARLRQSQQEVADLKANAKTRNVIGDLMATLLANPEQRAEMRATEVKTIKKDYAALFKQLNLSPEEQQKLIDLMADKAVYGGEKALGLMTGAIKPNDTEFQKNMAMSMKQFDDATEALLGADRFKQFNEFEQTLPDRTDLDQFKKNIKKTPLTGEQEQKLLALMVLERTNTPLATPPDDLQWKMDFDMEQKVITAHQKMNEQVTSQAAAFLNPAQLEALTKFQSNKLSSEKEDLKMLQQLFGRKPN